MLSHVSAVKDLSNRTGIEPHPLSMEKKIVVLRPSTIQTFKGNTGVGMVASSDSEFDEDEEEQKEAELLQARQLDRLEEEDFLDTFIPPDNKESKVGGNLWE